VPALPTSINDTAGIRWTGRLLAPTSGSYRFQFGTQVGDGVRFWIDVDQDGVLEDTASERLINAWPTASVTQTAAPIDLVGGQQYSIRIDAYEDFSQFQSIFRWRTPGQTTDVVVPSANLLVTTALETDTPSAVGNITLKNSSWSPAILAAIQAAGLGTGGVTIPLGETTPILPWTTGVNQISIGFDEDVNVTPGMLVVSGMNVPSYAVESVAYDPFTFTATWTLAQPIQSDRVTVNFAGVKDLAGNDLSGPITITVRALAGDGDRDGDVDHTDFQGSRTAQFTALGGAGYNVFLDTDTNSAINVIDWQNVFTRIGSSLPGPSPTAPAAIVTAATAHRARSSRSAAAATIAAVSRGLDDAAIDRVMASETQYEVIRARRRPSRDPR
jgi:hypothetical protein